MPAAAGQTDAVDNAPPVRNVAEARRYSGQKIGLFPFGQSVRLLADVNDAKARRFSQDTGIQVQVLRQPQDVAASATAAFAFFDGLLQAQSRDLDALSVDVIWTGALAPHLVDLNPKLSAEARVHYPATIQNNTVSGRLIGLPSFGDLGMLYYRTDLLQKYGFGAPPGTWEQLEQQAQRIVEGESSSNSSRRGRELEQLEFRGVRLPGRCQRGAHLQCARVASLLRWGNDRGERQRHGEQSPGGGDVEPDAEVDRNRFAA